MIPERPLHLTIVPIDITIGHTSSKDECDFCGSPLIRAWIRREQWSSKVAVVAYKFPIYICTGCEGEFSDPRAHIEFKRKELAVLRRYKDRGHIRFTREQISAAEWHLKRFGS